MAETARNEEREYYEAAFDEGRHEAVMIQVEFSYGEQETYYTGVEFRGERESYSRAYVENIDFIITNEDGDEIESDFNVDKFYEAYNKLIY